MAGEGKTSGNWEPRVRSSERQEISARRTSEVFRVAVIGVV
jgi:hypothetical protein